MTNTKPSSDDKPTESEGDKGDEGAQASEDRPKEIGGRKGPDPTRYGDWEKGGRCIDF